MHKVFLRRGGGSNIQENSPYIPKIIFSGANIGFAPGGKDARENLKVFCSEGSKIYFRHNYQKKWMYAREFI